MTARFYDRHRGIAGPGVPLPVPVARVADRWDGEIGNPSAVAAEIASLFAEPGAAIVRVVPPGPDLLHPGRDIAFGMITLEAPAEGHPRHVWRVLKFSPID